MFIIISLLFSKSNSAHVIFQPYTPYQYLWLNKTHYIQNLQDVYSLNKLQYKFKFNLFVTDILVCDDFLILQSNPQHLNRHSIVADYYIYKNDIQLIQKSIQVMGCFYYVKENSLFAINNNRLIQQGKDNQVFVARTDWVFEEELFSTSKAFKELINNNVLYSVFDDTNVHTMPILLEEDVYPKITNWKYPRPGTPNPTNSLILYYNDRKYTLFTSQDLICSDYIQLKQFIIYKVLTRIQDKLHYFAVALDTLTNTTVTATEVASFQAPWFEPQHDLQSSQSYFVDIINHILILAQLEPSFHILHQTGDLQTWESATSVNKIVCFNQKYVIYLATLDMGLGSMQQHVYKYDILHNATSRLTDHYLLHFENNNNNMEMEVDAGYFEANGQHADCQYIIIQYLGPLCGFESIYDLETDLVSIIENNNKDNREQCPYTTTTTKEGAFSTTYGDITVTRQQIIINNTTLNTMMIYPPTFQVGKTYPVIFNPYLGPDSQSATFRGDVIQQDPFKMMLLQLEFVIVVADGAGTCCLGPNNKYKVHLELGTLEGRDQLLLAEMIKNKPWSGVLTYFGWSYGGYMGLKIAEMDEEMLFDAIVAVAPVTDWLLYDTLYSERYMGLPSENANGYSISKINPNKGFKQPLMIAHGTGDDNVHFQQTLHVLGDLFKNKNMDISVMPYPDVRHSMGEYRMHLYKQALLFYAEKALFLKEDYQLKKKKIEQLMDKLNHK